MTEFEKGDVGFAWDDYNPDDVHEAVFLEYDETKQHPYWCEIKRTHTGEWGVSYYTNFSKTDPRKKGCKQ